MFIILILVMVSQVYTNVKTYQTTHFKYVEFIIYHLYLYKAVSVAILLFYT